MLRAPRSMPNSSGGTPITFACASLRVVMMVTSWVVGAPSGGAAGDSGGTIMFIAFSYKKSARRLLGASAFCAYPRASRGGCSANNPGADRAARPVVEHPDRNDQSHQPASSCREARRTPPAQQAGETGPEARLR